MEIGARNVFWLEKNSNARRKRLAEGVRAPANERNSMAEANRLPSSALRWSCDINQMGFETTRDIRRREQESGAHRTPIVALTASAMKGDRDRCLAAGMDAYVAKPFSPRELVLRVEAILRRTSSAAAADGPQRRCRGRKSPSTQAASDAS